MGAREALWFLPLLFPQLMSDLPSVSWVWSLQSPHIKQGPSWRDRPHLGRSSLTGLYARRSAIAISIIP